MGIGVASGDNRAAEAARSAVSSPLLESSIEGATGILLNITGGPDIGLFEVNEAAEVVTSAADQNANVIFGAVIDESMGDEVRVTVIATGFGGRRRRRRDERGAAGRRPVAAARSRPRGRARRAVLPARRVARAAASRDFARQVCGSPRRGTPCGALNRVDRSSQPHDPVRRPGSSSDEPGRLRSGASFD